MRISTNQMYQSGLNSLLTQQERTLKLQEQLGTGLRVQIPSDDPIAAAQIELMQQRISSTELLQHNKEAAKSKLEFEESVISDSLSVLQSLRELQVKAGSGALSDSDRKILATEAAALLNQLQGAANSKDNNGFYLFSGGRAGIPAVSINSSGQYIYNGDSTQRFQAITDSSQVAINDTGDALFMRLPNGNGHFSVSQTATNMGAGTLSSGAITNPAAYVEDNYTLSFALNSQGNVVYMVNGAASGQLIPPSGLPDDAPLYQDGAMIDFNGLEVKMTGTPENGDTFSIRPSQNESVFSTIQSMISNLNAPSTTNAEKALIQTQNNQLLEQIDTAFNNLNNAQSQIGNRLVQLKRADITNSDLLLTSQDTLRVLRDVNYESVATEFNFQIINLQAAQQSFVRIQNLSVFNYI